GRYKVVLYFARYWDKRDRHAVHVKIQDKTVVKELDLGEIRYRQMQKVVYDDAVVSEGKLVVEFLGEKPYVNALSVESLPPGE
ncbi:MAG: hypothetical protein OER86_10670, partial [Phycisphaerae bacterium]|nr:hypothetical protein [Phycisphaerae bacterium]